MDTKPSFVHLSDYNDTKVILFPLLKVNNTGSLLGKNIDLVRTIFQNIHSLEYLFQFHEEI